MFKRILAFLAAVLMAGSAIATPTANSVITAQTPKLAVVQFLQGTDSAGTYKTVYTGGASGTKVTALWANSNDASAAHVVTCQLVRAGVFYGGVTVSVGANAGFANGTVGVNLFSSWTGLPVDGNGNPYLYLSGTGDSLQCTFATALTASDLLNVDAVVSDF